MKILDGRGLVSPARLRETPVSAHSAPYTPTLILPGAQQDLREWKNFETTAQ